MHEMKISFAKLGEEECDKCEEFKLHNPNHKENSLSDDCVTCKNWSKHMSRAQEARRQYRQHADDDTNASGQHVVFSADLEKVVMLPRVDMFDEECIIYKKNHCFQ